MQGQNEEKSEEEITIIPDENITYGRKRKVNENEAEVIDKAEFEKHVQSLKRKKSSKLPSRIQPPRKMKKKEEEDDDDDEDDDQDDKDDIEDEMDGPKLEEKDEEREDVKDDSKKAVLKKNVKSKKRKIEKEKDDEDVKVIKEEKNKRSAYQRVTAKELMKNVLVGLSDKHKQAIKEIGFGAFLELDAPHYVDSWLTEQLFTNFDPERCCLMLPGREEEIFFDEIDVHMTYGLPMGDVEILDIILSK